MQLEDYFEFEKFDTKFGPVERIRIKGHRIAIDRVIEQYNQGYEPERIVSECYPTLSLAEVYATLAYYLHNKAQLDAYIQRGDQIGDAYYQEYLEKGPYFLRDEALAGKAKPTGNDNGSK